MDIVQANAPPEPQDEAPPPYTTLPRSPTEAGPAPSFVSPSVPQGMGYNPTGLKIGYTDFVPRIVSKRVFKDDVYEPFDTLVQRANNWLEEHRAISVVSCETVTWSGLKKKNIFSDSTVYGRSNNAAQKTYFIRGLRLWYFASAFPDAQSPPGKPIQCRTFIPRREERFDQLLTRANEALARNSIGGRILSVETVRFRLPPSSSSYSPSLINANTTHWKQRPDSMKVYVHALRVFATVDGTELNEKIGFKDFVPEHNRRNEENRGYEVFYDLMQRATLWVARQQGVRFTNLQSLDIKVKKRGPFEERCIFTEHMCARNRANFLKGSNKRTRYLKISRIFYTMHVGTTREEFPPARLTYRTFAPLQVSSATRESPAAYESMRQVLDRISQWLQITGARAFCFETVPVRQTTSSALQSLGAEATFSQTSPSGPMVEKWVYHIRVYLDGEYMEPPGAVSLVVPLAQPAF